MIQFSKESSERLELLRFPLIVGVVYVHAYTTQVALSSGQFGLDNTGTALNFIRNFISQGLGRIAVPLFFLISGYLFFWNFSLTTESYLKKLKSRTHSLLIPFLFWNLGNLILIALIESHPATRAFLSNKNPPIASLGAYDLCNALFGFTRYPIAYQFWFIRDLIILVLASPICYLLLKFIPRTAMGIFFCLWFFQVWSLYTPSSLAIVFFYAGAFLATNKANLFALDRFGPKILPVYLLILIADALTRGTQYHFFIHHTGILLGILSVLFLTKKIGNWQATRKFLLWAGTGVAFIVFAIHEPLLLINRKLFYKALVPQSDITVLLIYLFVPVLVICESLLVYVFLKKVTPRFLSVISGGR